MNRLYGRKVLAAECDEEIIKHPAVVSLPTMQELPKQQIRCLRCGQRQSKALCQLPAGTYFCPTCIQLGRVMNQQFFYHIPEPKANKREVAFNWTGALTAGQKKVSSELVLAMQQLTTRLVWAVTGAGKTEMLFQCIYQALSEGYRVGIVSPRVDVCLEIFPRIQAVFPEEAIGLFHGKAAAYQHTHLLICTTHQLLRFYQAFDVLIIDEVDAFPFVNDKMLHYGVSQAVKKPHCCIFLTATPTKKQQKQIKRKHLAVSLLPARYHRRILPVPKTIWCSRWYEKCLNSHWTKGLVKKIEELLAQNNLMIFCPTLRLMPYIEKSLKQLFPAYSLATVHSQDAKRLEKVQQMREKKYRILITSTILERGVTFDGISVLVLGANHPVFSTSALVQIAGRVDRQKSYTAGEVYFLHDGQSRAMKEAIKQINRMNQLAIKGGLVDEM